MPSDFRRHIPNLITVSRLVLALAFFAMLAHWPPGRPRHSPIYLNIATLIYVIAASTDFLDGYLARKWNVVSAFGRILDPLVDKILVLGTFAYFAGPSFVQIIEGQPITLTGVTPSVVIILIAREFLVTTLRGVAEASGSNYGAAFAGKLKMVFQCVTIFVILAYVNYQPQLIEAGIEPQAKIIRNLFVWATVAITIWSSYTYLRKSISLARNT